MTTNQNPGALDLMAYSFSKFGIQVNRAAATLPQTAAAAIFTVTGGRIAILGIVGTVGTVIQTQANATKLQAVATAGGTTDLCATLDITAKVANSLFGITGLPSDAMVNGGSIRLPYQTPVLQPGSLSLNCAASNTGTIAWDLWYLPLDIGASVVAA